MTGPYWLQPSYVAAAAVVVVAVGEDAVVAAAVAGQSLEMQFLG